MLEVINEYFSQGSVIDTQSSGQNNQKGIFLIIR